MTSQFLNKLSFKFVLSQLTRRVWIGGPFLIFISYLIHLNEGVHFNFKGNLQRNTKIHSILEKDYKIISWSDLKLKSQTKSSLIGKKVAIPGYVVPLSGGTKGIDEVLFVPTLQSCFHVPALKEDEIITAYLSKSFSVSTKENSPYWLVGLLEEQSEFEGQKSSSFLLITAAKLISLQEWM